MTNLLETIDRALGSAQGSAPLLQLCEMLGFDEKLPRPKKGEHAIWLSKTNLGIDLRLEVAKFSNAPSISKNKTDSLVLRGAFFYNESTEADHHMYTGDLPKGLDWSFSQAKVHQLLGSSTWSRPSTVLPGERWEYGASDRELQVDYSQSKESIIKVFWGVRTFFTI